MSSTSLAHTKIEQAKADKKIVLQSQITPEKSYIERELIAEGSYGKVMLFEMVDTGPKLDIVEEPIMDMTFAESQTNMSLSVSQRMSQVDEPKAPPKCSHFYAVKQMFQNYTLTEEEREAEFKKEVELNQLLNKEGTSSFIPRFIECITHDEE